MVGGEGASNAGDAAQRAETDALAASLGLEGAVLKTGYADAQTVSGHLLAADICVLPFRDGATLQRGTLLAALAHGLPVVSTTPETVPATGGESGLNLPRDWSHWAGALSHGDNVWLVPRRSPHHLAEAVRHLSANSDLRSVLSRGALSLARSLSWDAIASRHADLYADLGEVRQREAGA
jgi:glycosyltransferase involved in cell wall biosynthesis